jgi:hypothetical protein
MKALLFIALIALGTVLSGCVHYVKIKPGSPAPRVSINPASTADRQFVPMIASYFQKAGYQVVRGGPSEYDLNFGMTDHRVYVEVAMMLYSGGEKVTDGDAKVFAHPRYADHASVVNEAVSEALTDMEVSPVRVMPSR